MNYLNTVETTVSLSSKKIHFVELELIQKFNQHHICKILIDFEELDKKWMNDPVKIIKYIGESLSVTMIHKESKETNVFTGIVNNINFIGKHGLQNHIMIHAVSETIKLDGKPTMNSFVNKTLEDIVKEVVQASGNGAEVIVNPQYKKPIEYLCQYRESVFTFLNRLSYLYGEHFFCDGSSIYFGAPDMDDTTSIMYDAEMQTFNLEANMQPTHFQRYDYLAGDDEERIKETRYEMPELYGYQKAAVDKAESVFTSDAVLALNTVVGDSDSILKMVDIERSRTIADMLVLKGTTQTCKIKIGKIINIVFPCYMEVDTSAGDFIITELVSKVNQKGKFENSFSGVRAALGYVPVQSVSAPIANSERAIVISNADPDEMGRVQVQFQWQRYLNKETNWIRVKTLDGGSSNIFKYNRGFVFIPEKGDEVIIDYENADPNRPYVSGSLFSKNKAEGGKENNHLKTIRTRNGHRIEFDDDEESLSLIIKDKNDNIIKLDTKDKSILIQSVEKIDIKSQIINLDADDINLSSKRTTSTSRERLALFADEKVSIHSEDTVSMESFNILNISGKESSVKGTSLIEVKGSDVNIGAEDEILMSGNSTILNGESIIKIKAPAIEESCVPQQYPFKDAIVKREAKMTTKQK